MTFKLTVACFIIASLMAVEAAKMPRTNHKHGIHNEARYRAHILKDFLYRRSCVALGGTGCEGNNAKCCREGNPYTGKMRKCVNVGSFSGPGVEGDAECSILGGKGITNCIKCDRRYSSTNNVTTSD